MDEKTTNSGGSAAVPPPPAPQHPTPASSAPESSTPQDSPTGSPTGSGWSAVGNDAPTTVFGTPTAVPGAASGGPTPPFADAPTSGPAPRKGRRATTLLAGLAIGAILGGGAGAAVTTVIGDDDSDRPAQSSLDAEPQDNSDNQPVADQTDVGAVAQKVLPSVVSIAVETQFGGAGGSGVVISSDGQILTNNHVVEGAGQGGTVTVTFQDGTTAKAEVIGTDPLTDLAVIKAQDVSDLTPAELGSSSDLAVGEQVVAIGSPLGLDGTVTTGIVSALNRPVQAGDEQQQNTSVFDAIQTDAPINPGNSGGPLVNMNGEVIGINSVIVTTGANSGSIGLGFAIPIDQARPIAQELLDTGTATHARIGIGVGDTRDGAAGALVASVEANSSGAEAGLQEGDVITRLNDRVVTDAATLIAAARSYRPGDTVTITYLRDGQESQAEVTLGSDAPAT